jgi:hypothetical protein
MTGYFIFFVGGTAAALKDFVALYGSDPVSIVARDNYKFYVLQFVRSLAIALLLILPLFVLIFYIMRKQVKRIDLIVFILLLIINSVAIVILGYLNIKWIIVLPSILCAVTCPLTCAFMYYKDKVNKKKASAPD